ncbi:GntR family transcriptional regulator [Calidithermus timidus]|uniref:GntR family transcriptional regulator n=1 Tax=Calidithermus timidus TaxID=307124 RepID=UPI00037E00CE|nr:GntR family transcriptional regulator [Calidithermus timidus]
MTEFQRPSSVREAAYLHLRESILSGILSPGTRISEPGLAESLGISRTPVREALQRLSQEGLVELSPGRGARVRVITPQEVREVYEVRALLEAEGARLAALNATRAELEALEERLQTLDRIPAEEYAEQMRVDFEFHSLLMEASHNRTLARIYQDLRSGLALVRAHQQTLSQHPKTREQHHQILKALQQREAEQAARAARAHVLYFMEIVLEAAQRQGGKEWT